MAAPFFCDSAQICLRGRRVGSELWLLWDPVEEIARRSRRGGSREEPERLSQASWSLVGRQDPLSPGTSEEG